MKRLIALILFGLLIIAPAVYAQKLEFKASGFIDAQTILNINARQNTAGLIFDLGNAATNRYRLGGDEFDETMSFLDSRARLKFDAIMGKELSGTILRVGLQPLAIRPKLLVYTDGMGVPAGIKVDTLTIQPLWFKALEGKVAESDDVDIYGLHLNNKTSTFSLGAYGLFYDMKTYPINSTLRNESAKMWWTGVYADGKTGPVDLNFDLIYDHGKVKRNDITDPTLSDKVKYRGWVSYLKVDYPWEKANFGLVAYYATGADMKDTDFTGRPGTRTPFGTPTEKVRSFVVPPAAESPQNFSESVVFNGSFFGRGSTGIAVDPNYTQMARRPVGGTWMAKVYGSCKVSPDFKVTMQGLYIGDTTKNGNTFGTALKATGVPRDDNTIGWEADIIAELQIYKNLKYTAGFGYLWAGDAFDFNNAATGFNESPKNPWQLISNLTYTF